MQATLPKFLTDLDPTIYLGNNYVVLDFETSTTDNGSAFSKRNKLVLATWLLGPAHPSFDERFTAGRRMDTQTGIGIRDGVYYKLADEFNQAELIRAVETADFIVAQNAKFELQWLDRLGLNLTKLLPFDTLLAHYVELGNRRGGKNLDAIAAHWGLGSKDSLVKQLMGGGTCPTDIPESWLIEYGCQDTRLTHQIFLKQRTILSAASLLPVLYTRCLLTPVLADIERHGMFLDQKVVLAEYKKVANELREREVELGTCTGGLNHGSPKQVGIYLYETLGFDELTKRDGKVDRTEAGGRRTDGDTIRYLRARTDAQRKFQHLYGTYRSAVTSLNALEKMKAACEHDDGFLHGQFNQSVTKTHRLSSSGTKHKLQFHNFNRDYKRLFIPRDPKWRIGEADGSQLEFRVAAHLGRDQVASADIRNGFDPHVFTAAVLNGILESDVTKDQRQDAKPRTFKPLYGGMSGTDAERKYYKAFQQKYRGIYDAQKGWTYDVLKTKQLVTEWGLVFYWPDTSMSKSGYITNTTSIFNYPVQSFATAEIIPIAVVYFWHRAKLAGLRLFMINTIHDSVIVELPPEEEAEFRRLSETSFTSDVFNYLNSVYGVVFTVPLGTETKVGPAWSKGEERKYNLDPTELFGDSVV